MIRTLIRQGEENCKNHNIIKQYKEENQMLREEIDFRALQNRKYERLLYDILDYFDALDKVDRWENEESFKRMTRNVIKNEARKLIKKELDNAANID